MKKDHLEVLVEDVNDKLQILVEGMTVLQDGVQQVKADLLLLADVPADIQTIKVAVTETSADLKQLKETVDGHDVRLVTLEQAA